MVPTPARTVGDVALQMDAAQRRFVDARVALVEKFAVGPPEPNVVPPSPT